MKTILVTGGNGFVGRCLLHKLNAEYGNYVIHAPSSKEVNLMNYKEVECYFEENKIDVVIHLAAKLGGVGVVMNKQLMLLEDNLQINYNVVKCAQKYGVTKFITLGSSCSYSNDTPLPMKEEFLWKGYPENTYGTCKLVLLEHLKAQKEMDWVYLILPNIYGPDDHFGEKDAHFIPATVMKFVHAKQEGNKSIVVWGDGSQERDFVYVEDLVDIIMNSVESDKLINQPVNVATEIGVSVKEIVLEIRELLGAQSIDIEWDITKPTGILKKVLSNRKITSLYSGLQFMGMQEGLKKTIEWYKSTM
ncbi:MAG: NAD-dependent epimerase/dehydratase family protein [Lachnospiraceae bacterium]|nr:NAD-dependent epimerase/dehydratase family protein [Lachnospiraceae bacterium]